MPAEASVPTSRPPPFSLRDRVRVHWRCRGVGGAAAFTGVVVNIETVLNARNKESYRYQVEYDDGDRRWHYEGEERVEVLPPRAGAVVVSTDEWERLELRCAISMMRLADPAKGGKCSHRGKCNFDMLRMHAARSGSCPIVGCDAPLARLHEVQRDDALRDALSAVPAAVDVVWLRGTEVRTTAPPAAASASAVAVGEAPAVRLRGRGGGGGGDAATAAGAGGARAARSSREARDPRARRERRRAAGVAAPRGARDVRAHQAERRPHAAAARRRPRGGDGGLLKSGFVASAYFLRSMSARKRGGWPATCASRVPAAIAAS